MMVKNKFTEIILAAILFILLLNILFLFYVYKEVNSLQYTVSKVTAVDKNIKSILAHQRTPILSKVKYLNINGKRVKSKPYKINKKTNYVLKTNKIIPPKGWEPNSKTELDLSLPYSWPKRYINIYKQPFHPYQFFKNAAALCTHYKATGNEETLNIIRRLYDRFLQYTENFNGALFVVYRFRHVYMRQVNVIPWTSGYASGAALLGLTLIAECAGMNEAENTAEQILDGMARVISTKERPRFWVTFADSSNYLWFEEYPLRQTQQPRVLNGHIRALTGLYYFWTHTRNPTALKLLRAGITTVERYAPEYRIPGETNAYQLLQPSLPDYGPKRTIKQQGILYRMTGDPVFLRYRDMFQTDMAGK